VHKLGDLWSDERATMTAETALMVAFCALATITAWQRLSDTVENQAEASSHLLSGSR